jgi:hypothetical protein
MSDQPRPPVSIKRRVALVVALALAMLSAVWIGAIAAGRTIERQAQTAPPDAQRERQTEPDAPAISFIDSPSATCDRPVEHTNACYISWSYFYVNAGSNYMISMTVSIDDKIRANTQGFFQNSMYIPGDMLGQGFQVNCGLPGAGGNPALGATHSYTLRARDTTGLSAANYGSVTCPADVVPVGNLNLSGPASGMVNTSYTFQAAVLPVNTTLPVTYTWQVTDLSSVTLASGMANSQSFSWHTPGTKTITLEARNRVNILTQTINILIEPYQVFLPLIRR